jgi:SAM-dependent methyltransferase
MASEDALFQTDKCYLREVQYRSDANLAARQSVYAYQHPPVDLPAQVVGLAGLGGQERVADIGCGNGRYLAELARRQHAGQVLGVDASAGMLSAARGRVSRAALLLGDATALPLPDGACDLTVAAHMLYHVADPAAAVRELRRVTRPGGQVLVVLNAAGHFRELSDLLAAALPGTPASDPSLQPGGRLPMDQGQDLLAAEFGSVTRHDSSPSW